MNMGFRRLKLFEFFLFFLFVVLIFLLFRLFREFGPPEARSKLRIFIEKFLNYAFFFELLIKLFHPSSEFNSSLKGSLEVQLPSIWVVFHHLQQPTFAKTLREHDFAIGGFRGPVSKLRLQIIKNLIVAKIGECWQCEELHHHWYVLEHILRFLTSFFLIHLWVIKPKFRLIIYIEFIIYSQQKGDNSFLDHD